MICPTTISFFLNFSNGNVSPFLFIVQQVLVVRQDLKMGAGKIASQCARKLISDSPFISLFSY